MHRIFASVGSSCGSLFPRCRCSYSAFGYTPEKRMSFRLRPYSSLHLCSFTVCFFSRTSLLRQFYISHFASFTIRDISCRGTRCFQAFCVAWQSSQNLQPLFRQRFLASDFYLLTNASG